MHWRVWIESDIIWFTVLRGHFGYWEEKLERDGKSEYKIEQLDYKNLGESWHRLGLW